MFPAGKRQGFYDIDMIFRGYKVSDNEDNVRLFCDMVYSVDSRFCECI